MFKPLSAMDQPLASTSKVLVIIIMRFGENNVLGSKNIDVYQFCGSTLYFLFIIKKKENVQEFIIEFIIHVLTKSYDNYHEYLSSIC